MNHILKHAILSLALTSLASHAQAVVDQKDEAGIIVHLLDYLARDYPGAVSERGKILSRSEYTEQKEFAAKVLALSKKNSQISGNANLINEITVLSARINQAQGSVEVSSSARALQGAVISATHLTVTPRRWPNLKSGKLIFQQNCVSCHGAEGLGNGVLADSYDPRPANFADEERARVMTPLSAFHTIRYGVDGTAMNPFLDFSDQDVWDLAFYVNSLRYGGTQGHLPEGVDPRDKEFLATVAMENDGDLLKKVPHDLKAMQDVALVRTFSPVDDARSFLVIARTKLKDSMSAYDQGQFGAAKKLALEAYLEGFEPLEAALRAKSADLVVETEGLFTNFRAQVEASAAPEQAAKALAAALQGLDTVETTMNQTNKSLGFGFGLLSSSSIVFREGLEALILLISMISIVKAAKNRKALVAIHSGWLTSVGLSILGWIASARLLKISGIGRELMEAYLGLFAVLVVTYVGLWMHRQSSAKRWNKFISEKVQKFLTGNAVWGLALMSFIIVGRESLETILFLRAIQSDLNESGNLGLGVGVFGAAAILVLVGFIVLRWSRKLPLRQIFQGSAFVMFAVCIILVGKAVTALQEAGRVSLTQIHHGIRFEPLGVFPTWEAILAQSLLLSLILIVTFWDRLTPSLAFASMRKDKQDL